MSNRKKVILAIAGSILVHLFLLLAVTGYYAIFPPAKVEVKPTEPESENLPELTLVDPPESDSQHRYARTDDDQKTDKKPENPAFESDKDTAAATEKDANGKDPVPTQDGRTLNDLMFKNHDFSVDTKGDQFTRDPSENGGNQAPTPTPTPPVVEATPSPTPEASPDDLALAQPTTTPTPTPTPNIARSNRNRNGAPPTAYRPQQTVTRSSGNLTNRGRSSVSALGTPWGRFQKQVEDAVGSLWYTNVNSRSDLIDTGSVRIEFHVTPSGRVLNARVVSNTSNQTLASCSLQSVNAAAIPPMPEELRLTVPPTGIDFTYTFTFDSYH